MPKKDWELKEERLKAVSAWRQSAPLDIVAAERMDSAAAQTALAMSARTKRQRSPIETSELIDYLIDWNFQIYLNSYLSLFKSCHSVTIPEIVIIGVISLSVEFLSRSFFS